MEQTHREELERLTGGKIIWNYPLGKHTTFKAGGNVEAYYEAGHVHELIGVLKLLREEKIPFLIVGKGSNLLITDNGFEGVAIRLTGEMARIEKSKSSPWTLEVGAGAPVWEILAYCRKQGLTGLEFLAGIPGTAGGIVAMNAGAHGQCTGDQVNWVEILDKDGEVKRRFREELTFSYRTMYREPGSVIVKAAFQLGQDDPSVISDTITRYLMKRKDSQPLEYPSAGSVFKNPPGYYAGKLIEECELKGMRVGDAVISHKHANFIINKGQAKSSDILYLIRLIKKEVKSKFGIELELELQIVGK